jgi:hypothetical protein
LARANAAAAADKTDKGQSRFSSSSWTELLETGVGKIIQPLCT